MIDFKLFWDFADRQTFVTVHSWLKKNWIDDESQRKLIDEKVNWLEMQLIRKMKILDYGAGQMNEQTSDNASC